MDKKNKTGPKGPIKLRPDVINKLEQVFAMDGTIGEACFFAGISAQTYYNWIEKWPKYGQRFEKLRHKPILKARMTLLKALEDPEYALKYLERKAKREFSLRQEVSGPDGMPIQSNAITFVDFTKQDDTDNQQKV